MKVHFLLLYKNYILFDPIKTPDILGGLLQCTFIFMIYYSLLIWVTCYVIAF